MYKRQPTYLIELLKRYHYDLEHMAHAETYADVLNSIYGDEEPDVYKRQGIASWKTMFSVFVGGAFMGWVFNTIGPDTAMANMPWYEHLVLLSLIHIYADVVMLPETAVGKDERTVFTGGKYVFGGVIEIGRAHV